MMAPAHAKPDIQLPAGVLVLERGWLSSNNILFANDEQTVLVDSGYCTHAAQTLSLVEGALNGRPLDRLVNTHLHSDHCGGNAALQQRYSRLKTSIPPGDAMHVLNWDVDALTYTPTGQQCPPFGFDDTLKSGTSFHVGSAQWQVHAAPGHDQHSLIFFEPESRTLISADALWENGFGVVFPELDGGNGFSDVSATLDLIEALKPSSVIPGHGPAFAYTAEVMAKARSRLDAFEKNPVRHARHAAKVLLKFKLLESQQLPTATLLDWAESTRYFAVLHRSFFAERELRGLLEEFCDELEAVGALTRSGMMTLNR